MATADPPLVLLTGASGFIGSTILKQLLEDGEFRVRGTVRDATNEQKTKPLKELVPNAKYPPEFVSADLTKDEGWKEAIEGCTYIVHTASPVLTGTPNVATFVDAPVAGVKRLLGAVAEVGGVKRVVMTSSAASAQDRRKQNAEFLTEDDWIDQGLKKHLYPRGKEAAERAAWDMVKELPDDKKFELVTILPSVVFGPYAVKGVFSSNMIVKGILDHSMSPAPPIRMNVVDIRDVVKAHIKAITNEKAAGQRYLVSNGFLSTQEISQILVEEFGPQGYNVTTSIASNFMFKLFAFFKKDAAMMADLFTGRQLVFSSEKLKNDLGGFEFVPVRDMIIATGYSLIEHEDVPKRQLKDAGGAAAAGDASGDAAEAEDSKKAEDDTKAEDTKAEEAKTEEAKTEETKTEETKTEETKTEEPETEEPKAEEPKEEDGENSKEVVGEA